MRTVRTLQQQCSGNGRLGDHLSMPNALDVCWTSCMAVHTTSHTCAETLRNICMHMDQGTVLTTQKNRHSLQPAAIPQQHRLTTIVQDACQCTTTVGMLIPCIGHMTGAWLVRQQNRDSHELLLFFCRLQYLRYPDKPLFSTGLYQSTLYSHVHRLLVTDPVMLWQHTRAVCNSLTT